MKQLYLDIIAKLRADFTEDNLPHIDIWNDQVNQMEDQNIYSFPTPSVFIELISTNDIQRLGGGFSIYNNLVVRVHYVHQQLDAGDGTQERNLTVFDQKQLIFAALDNYEPNGGGMFNRTSEEQDESHTNIYHFIQDYETNYVDVSRKTPIGGIIKTPPTDLELNVVPVTEIT